MESDRPSRKTPPPALFVAPFADVEGDEAPASRQNARTPASQTPFSPSSSTRNDPASTPNDDRSATEAARPRSTRTRKPATSADTTTEAGPASHTPEASDDDAPAANRTRPPRKTARRKVTAEAKAPATAQSASDATSTSEAAADERPEVSAVAPDHGAASRTDRGVLSDADLVAAVRARPEAAPAALVMAAVGRLAEVANGDAAWFAETYPQVDPVRRARAVGLAARRRVRLAAGAAILGGPLGPVAATMAVGWAQIRLILGIAAVLGHDPHDSVRIEEVLVLLRAHPDAASAREAVGTLHSVTTRTDLDVLSPVLVRGGSRALATGIGSRIFPGFGALAAVLRHDGGTVALVERAVRFYR